MKNLLFIILLSFVISVTCLSAQAQNNKTARFEFGISYGLGYNPFTKLFSKGDALNLNIPSIGTFTELNLDYRLSSNKYIGIGYGKQQNSGMISDGFLLSPYDINIIMLDYKHIIVKQYVDFHFKMCFKHNMNLTVGVFYFFERNNTYDINPRSNDDVTITGADIVFYNERNDRADNFGVFASYEYFYPITKYLDVGIKAKIYLSLNEIEAAGILPTLKIRF